MSYTKRQFVNSAYAELGYSEYQYDIPPEKLQQGIEILDAMMGEWYPKIKVGYPLVTSPENSSLDTETEVPIWANSAIYTNLAIRLAPSIGKSASKDLNNTAKAGYTTLLSRKRPLPMQMPNLTPRGAGQKYWRSKRDPFITEDYERLSASPTDTINLG